MDKKLYIQPSFRVNVPQLDVYMQDISKFSVQDAEDLQIDNNGQDVSGDAKIRGEWSENGLW